LTLARNERDRRGVIHASATPDNFIGRGERVSNLLVRKHSVYLSDRDKRRSAS